MQPSTFRAERVSLESRKRLRGSLSISSYMETFVRLACRKIWMAAQLLCWRVLKPTIVLRSGIRLWINTESDWEVAKEILIDRDYDEAICHTFSSADSQNSVRILDLGANVGFFSARCIDLYLQRESNLQLELFAIEGAPSLAAELRRRLSGCRQQNVSLVVKEGLVGPRTGEAMIHSSVFHSCTNSVARNGTKTSRTRFLNRHAEQSAYLDLDQVISPGTHVDLIKCDIEGSELDFLRTYEDLLRRTRVLVIELHPGICNSGMCRELLDSYGFSKLRTIKHYPTHSLELYRRAAESAARSNMI